MRERISKISNIALVILIITVIIFFLLEKTGEKEKEKKYTNNAVPGMVMVPALHQSIH